MSAKLFVQYDARARDGNTDDAAVLQTADTEEEAEGCQGDFAEDSVWVEYDIDSDGKNLINEKMRLDIIS